jgi:hypothetical protein
MNDAARVRVSAVATSERLGTHPLYAVRIWVELPEAFIGHVLKVQYLFDPPSLAPKLKTSFDAATHFAIRYLSSGCEPLRVTIFERNGWQSEIPFDMCSAPGWREASAPVSSDPTSRDRPELPVPDHD